MNVWLKPLRNSNAPGILKCLERSWFLFQGQLPQDIAGPVGILQITHQVTQFGLMAIFEFTAMLSINLALVNFLPIPGLDGGRFLFILMTLIIRGKSIKKVEFIAIHEQFMTATAKFADIVLPANTHWEREDFARPWM